MQQQLKNITVNGAAGAVTVTDTKQTSGIIAVDGGTNVSVTAAAADISTGATSSRCNQYWTGG